jgi:glycosyltransferase involved in cell wall biosynthesis
MLDIAVIILTYNEEKHIERCIVNAKKIAKVIYIVDSFSTDGTVQIAENHGIIVYQNKWENNYAKQFNWGLDNLPIKTEWVFRLDADEYLTDDLIDELHQKIPNIDNNVSGVVFPLKRFFLNQYVKRGIGKMNLLRLFRFGKAQCEERWMDEHIKINEGKVLLFDNAFCDHNLNNIDWWTQKHNGYSIREAIDLLNIEYNFLPKEQSSSTYVMALDAEEKRKKKLKYAKMPLFWRSFFFFIYRYFFKLGFTEGKEAFLWHFLQGWWYRTLVDAKIYEIKKYCGNDTILIKRYIKENYNIEL